MTQRVTILVVALLFTCGAGVLLFSSMGENGGPPPPVSTVPTAHSAPETPAAPVSTVLPPDNTSTGPRPRVTPVRPASFRLWKFRAPVVEAVQSGAELVPPDDPKVLGWWGHPAGVTRGPTLLVGHTVHSGGGALDDLEHTPIGKIAEVSGVRYRVRTVQVISKAELARRAPKLFAEGGRPRLVVVTCEGYVPAQGTWTHNVVVVADLIT